MKTREEHIAECKKRALAYLDTGDVINAVTSMLSDLSKHDETKHTGTSLAGLGMLYAMNHDHDGARRFIEGFR